LPLCCVFLPAALQSLYFQGCRVAAHVALSGGKPADIVHPALQRRSIAVIIAA